MAAKKHWIAGAIKHPGAEKRAAAASGRSVHEQEEHDSHSSNKHVRARGLLGLRLAKMRK